MIELRVNYPNSIWGKLRTKIHEHKGCKIEFQPSTHCGFIVFDDTCQKAWWA